MVDYSQAEKGENPMSLEIVRDYDEYILGVVHRKEVQTLLKMYDVDEVLPPRIVITDTCGVGTAGQTWVYAEGPSDIELSSWILVSLDETRRVIRHEIAHIVKTICGLDGKSHGRGYTTALKAVSQQHWKKDKYWYPSYKINVARRKFHPRLKMKI